MPSFRSFVPHLSLSLSLSLFGMLADCSSLTLACLMLHVPWRRGRRCPFAQARALQQAEAEVARVWAMGAEEHRFLGRVEVRAITLCGGGAAP